MPTAVPLLKPSSSSDGSISVFCWVQVRWGDALEILPDLKLPEGSTAIDLLLLDGVPKETLAYLRAAEPLLAEGAVVVADNAGEVPWFCSPSHVIPHATPELSPDCLNINEPSLSTSAPSRPPFVAVYFLSYCLTLHNLQVGAACIHAVRATGWDHHTIHNRCSPCVSSCTCERSKVEHHLLTAK